MSEGISYRQINDEHSAQHGFGRLYKKHKAKALKKAKGELTGRSQKEQMRFTKQNRDYQNKVGRAWND
jgi:hypothetical protein